MKYALKHKQVALIGCMKILLVTYPLVVHIIHRNIYGLDNGTVSQGYHTIM